MASIAGLIAILVTATTLQACSQKNAETSKPAFVIKVDRDKSLPTATIRDNPEYDKYFDDAIESPSLNRDDFDKLFANALLAKHPKSRLKSLKDHRIELAVPGGNDVVSFTDNAWNDSKNEAGHRKEHLRTYLGFDERMQQSLGKVKASDVVPLVRGSIMVSQAQKDGIELPCFDIAPGLICILAADSPDNLRFLSKQEIASNGYKLENIKDQPVKTLMSHLPVDISVYGSPQLFMVTAGGDFESSLILNDKFMAEMQKHVKGRLLFTVPNKDILGIAGDATPEGMERLKKMAETCFAQNSRPISDKIYLWENGKITVYQ